MDLFEINDKDLYLVDSATIHTIFKDIYIYITNVKTIYDFANLIEGSKKALCSIEEQDYL
jgi:hypothetical protein